VSPSFRYKKTLVNFHFLLLNLCVKEDNILKEIFSFIYTAKAFCVNKNFSKVGMAHHVLALFSTTILNSIALLYSMNSVCM
jgi:hypothetical protein